MGDLYLGTTRVAFTAGRVVGTRIPLLLGASAATTAQRSNTPRLLPRRSGRDSAHAPDLRFESEPGRAHGPFRGVAKAVDIPIVVYNSPRRAGIAMSVDDIAAIADVAPMSRSRNPHVTCIILVT